MRITSFIQKAFAATALACLIAPDADAQITRFNGTNLSKTQLVSIAKHKKATASPAGRFVTINPTDYGTIEVVMEEDFSKFATGSEAEPDMDTNVILDFAGGECEYPWWNVDPSYTTLPNWGGANLFPAGGKVYMLESIFDGQGHINTPLLDFTSYDGGVAFFEFKAKTTNPGLSQRLSIEAAETNHMGPDWTVLGAELSEELTEDWQTFTVMYYGGGETTLFNIVPVMEQWWYENKSEEPCKVLFDDFKVYSLNQFVGIPKGLSHKNYKGTEFDLTWDAQDADYYMVDIYAVDLKTGDQYEFATGVKAETNTLHVTDAEPGVDYMFNVTAYKGDKKSFPSLPGIVFDIENPEFTGTPEFVMGENGLYTFTSEWNDVPSAQVYNYALLHKRPAYFDGAFEILNEDFTGVQDADGLETEWTIEEPSYSCYGFLPIKPMKQAGWVGKSIMPFKDFICLDGWQHIVAKADAYIASPELDLSKDNGNLHLSVKLFGRIGGWFDPLAQEQHDNIQTKAAVSLYNYDEATGSYVQAEYVPIEDVTTAWNTFDVDLTQGSERSFIVIEAIDGPEHLYIDDLVITQNYKKGEYLIEPCIFEYWYEYSIIDVELPENSQGLDLIEKVSAQKSNPMTGEPARSEYVSREIGKAGEVPAGIQDAAIEKALVSFSDGQIMINNAEGEAVSVYSIDGKLVYSNNSGAANMSVRLSNGAYLVKVGEKSVKVSL